MVFAEVPVDRPAIGIVDVGFFVKGEGDAPDDAADELGWCPFCRS